jgi:hypothetical protein
MASQLLYQLVSHTAVPLLSSSISRIYSYYSGGSTHVLPTSPTRSEVNEEKELDAIHMERLLKWMHIIFDSDAHSALTPGQESHKEYKKELYSIYVGIVSDYKQYQQWKHYNHTLWLMSSYRKKNTKALAAKILGDIKSFHDGLQMFALFSKS